MLLLRVVLIRPSSSSDINSMGFAPFDRKAESAPGCSLPLPQGSLLSTTSQSRQVLQSCFCGSCFCALQTQSRQVLQSCFCSAGSATVLQMVLLQMAPEGNAGSCGPLEESMGGSTSPALSCGVSTPATSTA